MTGRCSKCQRTTATRAERAKVAALIACRVGFVLEAEDGRQLERSVLLCLPCISNSRPTSIRRAQ